ncbi:3-ketoacyl-(acyl-carrier-protein) reductase [Cupriavidus basilensis OR16]|uniref:3-ketoacyl-(Acyl-carrier-protein) reductase n=1 Tax=Cupriavidus basilensis OR16 TaxID=1127483 RepID=H1SAF2_9BURK|nr:SDR family oxidoreductase [Cupriavidus basilensis]EHP40425.1 3-ketoacyl-(acyl-carrier-protein) reductase [Cupriavidus basilensis OR16]
MQIKGAIALVTGGVRGLGLAIAMHLHERGATVIVADRDAKALNSLPEYLAQQVLDVTSPDEAKAVMAAIVAQHGRIDILVNNAGVIFSEPFVNVMNPAGIMHDYGRFRDSLTVNLDSVFIMTSAAVEQMVLRRTKGAIINISSISACGNEGQTAYSAAKAGVNAMTVTWSKELGRWGIRCNAIAPGFIGTESTRQALSEAALQHIQSNTPLRRLGEVDEVAKAVAAVIENDFMTGVVLNVNGGLTI